MVAMNEPPVITQPVKPNDLQFVVVMSDDANRDCRKLNVEAPLDHRILSCSGILKSGKCMVILDIMLPAEAIDGILKNPAGCGRTI